MSNKQTAVEYLIEQLTKGELKFEITKKSLIISQTCGNDHIATAKKNGERADG